jgi:hypothetical protein
MLSPEGAAVGGVGTEESNPARQTVPSREAWRPGPFFEARRGLMREEG